MNSCAEIAEDFVSVWMPLSCATFVAQMQADLITVSNFQSIHLVSQIYPCIFDHGRRILNLLI